MHYSYFNSFSLLPTSRLRTGRSGVRIPPGVPKKRLIQAFFYFFQHYLYIYPFYIINIPHWCVSIIFNINLIFNCNTYLFDLLLKSELHFIIDS